VDGEAGCADHAPMHGRTFALDHALVALALGATTVGCRDATKAAGTSDPGPSVAVAPAPAAVGAPGAGQSIYTLRVTLTDQDGGKYGLDVFRGNPVLVGMFYGRCQGECPAVTALKTALSLVDDPAAASVRVLLVSFDPSNDTPAALHAMATERGLDRRWKLASAPDEQARDLAAALGTPYRRLQDGTFNESPRIVLLDHAGAIAATLDDPSQPMDALVARASAIAAAEPR
jgi:protein SCO1